MREKLARVAAASTALALLELAFLDLPLAAGALAFLATLFVPSALAYAYWDYRASARIREIEDALPDALLQAASQPRSHGVEDVMESIAGSGYGALSEEFDRAARRVRAGSPIARALEKTAVENGSVLFSRAAGMLANASETGGDQRDAFKETAEDLLEMQLLERETAAGLAMQKYTVLAASAFLVPVILALLLNITAELNSGLTDGLSSFSSLSAVERARLVDAVALGSRVYLALFALLSSYYAASVDGNPKKTVVYAALAVPLALLVFEFLSTAGIL
ncbi:MAG: type II secretion system F family protein [Candidatus Micrarchaeia archaeon]